MFFSNLLIFGAFGATTVSGRAIGDLLHFAHLKPTHPSTDLPSTQSPPPSASQCQFHPHDHLTHELSQRPISIPSNSNAYTNIPLHAWPHITSLLLSHSQSLIFGPLPRNNIQTLHLSSVSNDVTLENVVLGLVFTAPEFSPAANHELRSVDGKEEKVVKEEGEGKEKDCLEEAIMKVEEGRMVEGVFEMDGKGKVGFLVYRDD